MLFEVARGEVFGRLGQNGAGKTTTVRLMNGVLQPHGCRQAVLTLVYQPPLLFVEELTPVSAAAPSRAMIC